MSALRHWAPLPFVAVAIVTTVILTALHLVELYVLTTQQLAQDGTGQNSAGTVAFFAVYLIPSALIEGLLIGLAAFAVARLLKRGHRVSQRAIALLAGLVAAVVALCLMVVPLVGYATGGLLQLGAGIAALLSGEAGSGPANLIAAIALALLLYVGAFTLSARRLFNTAAAGDAHAR
ncbi:hypothetical protein [Rathayibacter sp. PhB151]|uniref:hypothetical protein n=1 Tax=Rathayibacter sp. PhB151 TaxID=2485189 RepID=UPI001063A57A|nr:hypothetical protein [Rathayibacter sp. PhB151]